MFPIRYINPYLIVAYVHLFADFTGARAQQLGDPVLLSGLLIAAAGAVGLTASVSPAIRTLPDGGLQGVIWLEGCHMFVHSVPDRGTLLLDVLVPDTHDPRKALDVFTRRLTPAQVRSEQRARG